MGHEHRSLGSKSLILATTPLAILMWTSWLLKIHCFLDVEDHLHNYVSFIRIPGHYFQYHNHTKSTGQPVHTERECTLADGVLKNVAIHYNNRLAGGSKW